jgi:uncharacterized protein YdeI (YjbR/CyaY-like superfamily)
MRKEGLAAYEELKKRPELAYENRSDGEPEIPEDLMSRLAKNRIALENFLNFSKSYRRMYLDWLSTAKKPKTRAKRIDRIFGMAEANLKPGIL